MYTPSSFKEESPDVLFELIEKYNFGILFSQHSDNPEATHLPFLVDKNRGERGTLVAHFARANKHWNNLNETKEVLAVFQGPHTYITPSWYKNRDTVPTWNYATVHVYGKPKVIHELDELRKMVTRLTHFHESQVDSNWSLEESEKSFDINLKGITGLEIEITRMEGKFKFNQNKKKEDQQGVIENLENLGEEEVSSIMKENLKGKP
ncbi:MAG: FMN-binding negative transcriptional regulator [Balneolaceae bacterium]|nr:FMN-binding negative transcriptional regulator [Balneolaceae bacterium]MBO6545150.1 FMN-binding negative transcriptional regulator [Balneolaceae bacterium]MBO6646546.1 FMN-binding negative transcriptional regulator [Balneolaceae bacterium]